MNKLHLSRKRFYLTLNKKYAMLSKISRLRLVPSRDLRILAFPYRCPMPND